MTSQDPMRPDDFRGSVGEPVPRPSVIGWTTIPVLEFLVGRKWDWDALNVVYAVQPSYLRVVGGRGELKTDSRPGRVTVELDGAGNIRRIEQEVAVGLVGRRNGGDVSRYIRGECRREESPPPAVEGRARGDSSTSCEHNFEWVCGSAWERCAKCGAQQNFDDLRAQLAAAQEAFAEQQRLRILAEDNVRFWNGEACKSAEGLAAAQKRARLLVALLRKALPVTRACDSDPKAPCELCDAIEAAIATTDAPAASEKCECCVPGTPNGHPDCSLCAGTGRKSAASPGARSSRGMQTSATNRMRGDAMVMGIVGPNQTPSGEVKPTPELLDAELETMQAIAEAVAGDDLALDVALKVDVEKRAKMLAGLADVQNETLREELRKVVEASLGDKEARERILAGRPYFERAKAMRRDFSLTFERITEPGRAVTLVARWTMFDAHRGQDFTHAQHAYPRSTGKLAELAEFVRAFVEAVATRAFHETAGGAR